MAPKEGAMRFLCSTILLAVTAHGQWIGYKVPGVPRTKDGKPNLSAPAPRVNGKPDLSGIWITLPAKYGESEGVVPGIGILAVPGDDPAGISKYFFNVMADYKPDEITMTAAAQKRRAELGPPKDPCLPPGPPMSEVLIVPRRVVQTPTIIAYIYEGLIPRQIHLDGRALPVDPQPAYAGYSVGRWEGDTLVVETIGVTENMPLDGLGHPRSSKSRLVERIRRRDFGHMDVELTIHDPDFYSKPIVARFTQTLMPDDDLLESVCENEKDREHMRPPGPPPQ
jgi:hypothetical protein